MLEIPEPTSWRRSFVQMVRRFDEQLRETRPRMREHQRLELARREATKAVERSINMTREADERRAREQR